MSTKSSICRLLYKFPTLLTSPKASSISVPYYKSICSSQNCSRRINIFVRQLSTSGAADASDHRRPSKDEAVPPPGNVTPLPLKVTSKVSDVFSAAMNLPQDEIRKAKQRSKLDLEKWTPIYSFPKIRMAGIIQRLKLYQTAFTCFFAVPGVVGCYIYGMVGEEVVIFTSGVCGLACAMLYIMGNFFSRLIGHIYISKEDPELVRIAHMTFWGGRKDEYYKKTDFIPFSDLPDNIADVYIHVKVYDEPKSTMYLSLKYGNVLDKEQFEEVFGGISEIFSSSNDIKKQKTRSSSSNRKS